jgi:signal transduction histidine kinase
MSEMTVGSMEKSPEGALAQRLKSVVLGTMAVATAVLSLVALFQPDQWKRCLLAIALANANCLIVLGIRRLGFPRAAAAFLLAFLIAQVVLFAPRAGGIRSPGIGLGFIYIVMAGYLLGGRAAITVAVINSLAGLGLVAAEHAGTLPPQSVFYRPLTIWLLQTLYAALLLMLVRLSTRELSASLKTAREENLRRRESEGRLKLALEAGGIGTWELIVGEDSFIGDARAFAVLGLEAPVSLRLRVGDWAALIAPEDRVQALAAFERLRQGSPGESVEYAVLPPGGARRHVVAVGAALLDGAGRPHRVAGFVLDMTQRHEMEAGLRQSQKLEALGTLTAGIAHDFNNILAGVNVAAELGADEAAPGSLEGSLFKDIVQAGGRAKSLVKRILLFSRQQPPERSAVDLGDLVQEVRGLLALSHAKGVRIVADCDAGLPKVFADPSQMHQVLMNLGTNALYAMRGQGGELKFRLEAGAERHSLRLSVSDSGPGIPPEIQGRVFEPFFSTKGQDGTGLGLSVVHGIVREHGGQISVHSAPGEGTRFEISLPAMGPGSAELPAVGEPRAVLYVDDEEVLADLNRRLIEGAGHRCTALTDPQAALTLLRDAPQACEILITDLHMPGMNGAELIRAARALQPGLPVVVLSGDYDPAVWGGETPSGLRWMPKPPDGPSLRRLLAELGRELTQA